MSMKNRDPYLELMEHDKERNNYVSKRERLKKTAVSELELKRKEFYIHYEINYERLVNTYGDKCSSCGAAENIEVTHIVALSRLGTNDLDNLQLLCEACNKKKGRRIIDYRKKNVGFLRAGEGDEQRACENMDLRFITSRGSHMKKSKKCIEGRKKGETESEYIARRTKEILDSGGTIFDVIKLESGLRS